MGILDYFLSSVQIQVTCHSAERFLNICAENGIKFRNVEKINGDEVILTVRVGGCRWIERNAARYGYTVAKIDERGFVFTVEKLKKRYVLIFGLALCAVTLWISSLFVWEINVSGNDEISETEILAELDKLGVGIGTFRPRISQEYISNEMLQRIEKLSFIAVNVTGSHAEVIVREERETPEIESDEKIQNVVAAKSGVITKFTVLEGTAKFKKGDTVNAGDELVSAVKDSVSSGKRLVRANAEVYARTWYEIQTQTPAQTAVKSYTGDKNTRFAIILCGKRINLYFSGRNTMYSYDKIIKLGRLRVFDIILPLQIISETAREYVPEYKETDIKAAEERLSLGLENRLKEEIGEDGEIIGTEFETSVTDGIIKVTLKAECIERIDKQAELSEEEKLAAGKEDGDGGENNRR